MKYSNKTNTKLNDLQALITKELKARIKSLGLVDSGLLLNSTMVNIKFTNDGLDIELKSTDYYKYLDSDYDITDYVMKQNNVSDLMDEVFGLMMMDILLKD